MVPLFRPQFQRLLAVKARSPWRGVAQRATGVAPDHRSAPPGAKGVWLSKKTEKLVWREAAVVLQPAAAEAILRLPQF